MDFQGVNPEVMDAELQFATRRGRERLSEKPALCNNWLCERVEVFFCVRYQVFNTEKPYRFLAIVGGRFC